jgi:CBS domain-containing protein
MPSTVRDVMTIDPIALPSDTTLQEAAARMRDADIGDVLVLDDNDQLRGIVTDRDITVRGIAEGRDPNQTRIIDLCSADLVTASPSDNLQDAAQRMREAAIRRLPVVENGRPVGIVALGDLAVDQDTQSALADISAADPNR